MGWLTAGTNQMKDEDGSRKRGRTATGAGGSMGDIEPLQATLVLHNSRLQLNLAQRTRLLEGVNFEVFTTPTSQPVVQACVEAGKQYGVQVKGNKNHGLGPPHPHIWHALIKYLSTAMDCENYQEADSYLKDLEATEPIEVLMSIRACRTKQCYDTKKTNLSFCIIEGPQDALPHARAMEIVREYLTKVAGADRRIGPPPASGLERDVQKLHDRLGASLEQHGITLPTARTDE
jgi:hypothetical protein